MRASRTAPQRSARHGSGGSKATLAGYFTLGAMLGALFLLLAIRAGVIEAGPSGAAAPSASHASALPAPCALHASPPACDACMNAHCRTECSACADSADCLDLFLCAIDCHDPACERACADAYPAGKLILQRFMGESGCLAMFCRDDCPRQPAAASSANP